MTFEETPKDFAKNFISLGFDFPDMMLRGLIATDHVYIERSEIEETGEYDLEGLFIRLGNAIDSIGAQRVVLDTIEALFSGLSNAAIFRAELRRLFHWLKDRGVSAIVTGESGEKLLTRYGLEEYVADRVIFLDFRVEDQISTRRLRMAKYRGSSHGADEYPFLIDESGLSILPITSRGPDYHVSTERIATGVPKLDAVPDGKGFYRGSTILVSGTGKEFIAAAIHNMSTRKERPLITVNSAALPANLIDSELFGRGKGAFTGADARRVGRFEIAHGSTGPGLHGAIFQKIRETDHVGPEEDDEDPSGLPVAR
jgi:circadian clock protein KaiC